MNLNNTFRVDQLFHAEEFEQSKSDARMLLNHLSTHVIVNFFRFKRGVICEEILANYMSEATTNVLLRNNLLSIFEHIADPDQYNMLFDAPYSRDVLRKMILLGMPMSWVVQHGANMISILVDYSKEYTTDGYDLWRSICSRMMMPDLVLYPTLTNPLWKIRNDLVKFLSIYRDEGEVFTKEEFRKRDICANFHVEALLGEGCIVLSDVDAGRDGMQEFLIGYNDFNLISTWLKTLDIQEPPSFRQGICAYGVCLHASFKFSSRHSKQHCSFFKTTDIKRFLKNEFDHPMLPIQCTAFWVDVDDKSKVYSTHSLYNYSEMKCAHVYGSDEAYSFALPKGPYISIIYNVVEDAQNRFFCVSPAELKSHTKRLRDDGNGKNEEGMECVICKEPFIKSTQLTIFNACHHVVCEACFENLPTVQTLRETAIKQCPTCRQRSVKQRIYC